jgi:hypothetical protein
MRKASVLITMLLTLAMVLPLAAAQETGFALKPSVEMADILIEQAGKRVAVKLTTGEEIEGTVTTVGKSLVHISRLAGKEFYDSIISIDKISAIRIRVRER